MRSGLTALDEIDSLVVRMRQKLTSPLDTHGTDPFQRVWSDRAGVEPTKTSDTSPSRTVGQPEAASRATWVWRVALRVAARAIAASAEPRRERCSSTAATIRSCSARGGTGIATVARFFREIRFRVVPLSRATTQSLNSGELTAHISQAGRIASPSGRMTQTSTTVTAAYFRSGTKQARPMGSGIRANSTSPFRRYVQLRRSAVSSFSQRSDRSRNSPSPTSAS